ADESQCGVWLPQTLIYFQRLPGQSFRLAPFHDVERIGVGQTVVGEGKAWICRYGPLELRRAVELTRRRAFVPKRPAISIGFLRRGPLRGGAFPESVAPGRIR